MNKEIYFMKCFYHKWSGLLLKLSTTGNYRNTNCLTNEIFSHRPFALRDNSGRARHIFDSHCAPMTTPQKLAIAIFVIYLLLSCMWLLGLGLIFYIDYQIWK
jgi:hypothetical protein